MLKKRAGFLLLMFLGLLVAVPASAHTPMLYVEDYFDGTVYLEGGFSDGSSAADVEVFLVEDKKFSNDTTTRDEYLEKIFNEKPEEKITYLAFISGQNKDSVKQLKFSELKPELYNGKLIIYKTKLDEYSELTIEKPEGNYIVVFNAGPGHQVEKQGPVLTEEEREN